MLVKFDVLQEYIDSGKKGSKNCVVYQTLQPKIKCPIQVGISYVEIEPENEKSFHINLSNEVRTFIADYLLNSPVFPFSFEVEIPDEYLVGVRSG